MAGYIKVLKGKNLQPRLLYLAWISFKIDEEIKSFSEEQKFSTTKPDLQQMLKGLIVKKYKRRIKIYKINPEQFKKKKGNKNIYLNY